MHIKRISSVSPHHTHSYVQASNYKPHETHIKPAILQSSHIQATFTHAKQEIAPCTMHKKRKRRSNAAKCVVRKGGNKNTTPNKTRQSQPNHE
jgi:hypothetical protein